MCVLMQNASCVSLLLFIASWVGLQAFSFQTALNHHKRINPFPPVTFYNSYSRKKELFRPQNPNSVSFYSCGPTLYDNPHIGNFRAFLTYVHCAATSIS